MSPSAVFFKELFSVICPEGNCVWKKLEKICIYKHAWFVFPYFRVHLAFLDWKVKVETMVLRWGISYDLMTGWKHFTQTEKQIVLLITKLVLVCFNRVLVAPKVPQGSLARQASGWVNSLTSSTRTAVCVCACMPLCLLCGCLYLSSLLSSWEAYFHSNKQLLEMCLKACGSSNLRINGWAVNLSENAKTLTLTMNVGRN